MKKTKRRLNQRIQSAIRTVFAVTAVSAVAMSTIAAEMQAKEENQCYGIARTGMNDCATATASCAGSAIKIIKQMRFFE